MAPRIYFEQELEQLNNRVLQMGEQAEKSYGRLVKAISENDRASAERLLDNDRHITDMQRSIEAMCLTLMTKEQPVARDMRLISAALKVVTDIERVGDHVSDIAGLYLRTGEFDKKGNFEGRLLLMMEEAKKMMKEAVCAFAEGDEAAAKRVIAADDAVDDLFNEIKEKMLEAIRACSLDADKVVDYLMIAKYLEKIGDHAVNIGQWAIFRLTGDMEGVKLY